MEPIAELFSPSNYQPEAVQHLSLGNLALKAYAKFYLIPSPPGTKETDELTSELMNCQCLFNYIENTWPKYANYEEDSEVEWEIATLLQQVEWILSELDGMDTSDPLTDAQKSLILEYRARLCVYIHMACLQIVINAFQNENTGAVARVEKLLCAFIDRFHTPVSPKDNQLLEWLNSGVPQLTSPDVSGERAAPGAAKGPEPNKRPPRHRVPVGVRKFENAAPAPEQSTNGVSQSHSNNEIILKIIKVQGTTGEEEEYRFPLRNVQPNDKAILSKPMALELPDTEEHIDAREALRSIVNNVSQWLVIFPGPGGYTPRKFYSFPFQGIAHELEDVGREMMKMNLFYQAGDSFRPNYSIINSHYFGWTVREWMRLARWWLSRGVLERMVNAKMKQKPPRKRVPSDQTLDQWLTDHPRGSNKHLPLIKAIFIFCGLVGGSGIWHLLDATLCAEMEKLDKDIRAACSQNGTDVVIFLQEINKKLSKGKTPIKVGGPSNGSHSETTDLESLILTDKVHRHEEIDGFGADNVVAQFQALVAVEFNTRPSGPISNHDITVYSLLEVGYTDRKRNVPQLRLQNSQGDIIKSAPLSDWMKIETDQVGNPYDMEVWSIKVREMFVSFAICVEQDRVNFSGTCEKVRSGAFLKKEKSKSWSIESATYRTSFRAQPLTCRAGELTIKEHLLPGAEGSSRKRSIVIEPRYRGQIGFTIDHIPLHKIEVRDAAPRNTSNGAAIEISWRERAVPQDEYMFSPFNQLRYPKIHHYHLDSQNGLHYSMRHTHQLQRQPGPRRLPGGTQIPADHAQSRMVCAYQPNGSYFMQDGVVGEHRYEGSSWTCPFSGTDSLSEKAVVMHWLTLNLTNYLQDFYRWLFQKDPDELCLENHIYTSSNTSGNQTSELHVFESELFSERRIVEIQTRGYEQKVQMSFINTLSSLAYENIAPRIQGYRLKDMLSHPYGSRLFDGDVGKDWQNFSSGISEYGVDTIQQFPIIDILCPHWLKIPEEKALCNFMELTLRPSVQSRSIMRRDLEPIFVRKNGKFKFFQDPLRRLFLLWVYGESGNGFVYFWIKSFPSQILKLNNKLRLSVMYELNSVTGIHAATTAVKEGVVDISFADCMNFSLQYSENSFSFPQDSFVDNSPFLASSSFRRYCQSRITSAITGRFYAGSLSGESASIRSSVL
ncbi:uncharacterized protein DFL_004469 [Arthrobotrys flagrans]|uniref:Uncharacterized protein n=1 Tax=Arthrobotrys flagrans TaxID=97331 RepID=A0A437A5B1_ARTFL|nr:hypothetical protein DFL_004469 [Arthrobotrys flagrans]